MIYADNIYIMGDMTIKEWKIGDKVTPIRGHLRGVPCVIKWSGWPVALVTIVTVHGCWRSVHPNNLRSTEG